MQCFRLSGDSKYFMSWRKAFENFRLEHGKFNRVEGKLCFDPKVMELMLKAPLDLLPGFQGPSGRKAKRGKEHPRLGRFVYALARHYNPQLILEVGTSLGGTAVGWAAALRDNQKGTLLCIDQDVYCPGVYPAITRNNLLATGLSEDRFDLRWGDSHKLLPQLIQKLKQKVDIYLVDGDHTYEGAYLDLALGLPLIKPGGFILVHDVDRGRKMAERTKEHPYPVYEAFMEAVEKENLEWCILKFIRKHLGVIRNTGRL